MQFMNGSLTSRKVGTDQALSEQLAVHICVPLPPPSRLLLCMISTRPTRAEQHAMASQGDLDALHSELSQATDNCNQMRRPLSSFDTVYHTFPFTL